VSQPYKQEVNWEFLLGSSKSTLQAYEQSRLNFAANLRKEIAQLLDVWVDESSNALLARWLIERNLSADVAAICTNSGAVPSPERNPGTPAASCVRPTKRSKAAFAHRAACRCSDQRGVR
jgi:hypothetical protein